jgi:hypothetical protein
LQILLNQSSTNMHGLSLVKLLFEWTAIASQEQSPDLIALWMILLKWMIKSDVMHLFWSTFILLERLQALSDKVMRF